MRKTWRPSWRLACEALAGRPGRTLLLLGAVALAASLIVSVSCTSASARESLKVSLTRLLGSADARIVHLFGNRFSDDAVKRAAAWPEVDRAIGISDASLAIRSTREVLDEETGREVELTPKVMGIDFEAAEPFQLITLRAGTIPGERHEVTIDPSLAEQLKLEVGDTITASAFTNSHTLRVAGITDREILPILQRSEMYMDHGLHEELLQLGGKIDRVAIKLRPGVDLEAFITAHAPELPEVLTLEKAELAASGLDRQMAASDFGLRISTILTFLAASFIIVTGLTAGVTEQQRQMAILRCIGATRLQLFCAQLGVGVMIGVAGALLGVPLGIGLTKLLVWWFSDVLPAGHVIDMRGIWLAAIGSVIAGVAGALWPAVTASRVAPLEAMTQQANPPTRRGIALFLMLGFIAIAAQLVLLLVPDVEQRFNLYAYIGLPLLHIGYFLLAIPFLLLLGRTVGEALGAILRLPFGIVSGSLAATPYRHGFMAGALMVGMSILVSNWAGAQAIYFDWLNQLKFADGFALRPLNISPEQQDRIRALPFVEQTCPISVMTVPIVGEQVFGVGAIGPKNVKAFGFEPDEFFAMNTMTWVQGDLQSALPRLKEGDAVLVADRFLVARNIGMGDTITLGRRGVTHTYEIVGVVSAPGLDIATQLFGMKDQYAEYALSAVFMDYHTLADDFDHPDARMLQVNLSDDVDDEDAREAITRAVPGTFFISGREISDTIDEIAFTTLALQNTIALAAMILASIAVGNVIAANIGGRSYEFGVLRAIGGGRSLLVRLIMSETVVIAVTATMLGTILGYHLALISETHYRDLAGLQVNIRLPLIPTSAGWLLLLILTVMAALPPTLKVIRRQPSMLLATGRNE